MGCKLQCRLGIASQGRRLGSRTGFAGSKDHNKEGEEQGTKDPEEAEEVRRSEAGSGKEEGRGKDSDPEEEEEELKRKRGEVRLAATVNKCQTSRKLAVL